MLAASCFSLRSFVSLPSCRLFKQFLSVFVVSAVWAFHTFTWLAPMYPIALF